MQPTFLPWTGYFALMLQSDAFVFLDSVQFAKRTWQQRNRIKTANGPLWVSVPVFSKGARDQKIAEVMVDVDSGWAEKAARTIQMNYAKAPHFSAYGEPFLALLRENTPELSRLNQKLIVWLMEQFGIRKPLYRSSELNLEGSKAELLANICEVFGATKYVSALGSKEYIDESDAFSRRQIEVVYNQYSPRPYRQLHGDFDAYMAAIDLLFNEGPNARAVLESGLNGV